MGRLQAAAERDDDEGDGEGQQELTQSVMRQQGGDQDPDADRAEAPEEVDERERGAGALVVAATSEDVGGSNELAEADAGDKQSDGTREEAAGIGKCGQSRTSGEQAEKDSVTQLVGDGRSADESAQEFCKEQHAGLVVGQMPLMRKGRQDRTE